MGLRGCSVFIFTHKCLDDVNAYISSLDDFETTVYQADSK